MRSSCCIQAGGSSRTGASGVNDLSKARMRVNLLALRVLFRVAGNGSIEGTKGCLFTGKEEEEAHSLKKPLICRAHHFERRCPEAQYPVATPARNPFKLCDFPLVTPASLLY